MTMSSSNFSPTLSSPRPHPLSPPRAPLTVRPLRAQTLNHVWHLANHRRHHTQSLPTPPAFERTMLVARPTPPPDMETVVPGAHLAGLGGHRCPNLTHVLAGHGGSYARSSPSVVWTSLGPLPRWVPGPTTRWAPGTTRLAVHGI
jgi:hypothetical protein